MPDPQPEVGQPVALAAQDEPAVSQPIPSESASVDIRLAARQLAGSLGEARPAGHAPWISAALPAYKKLFVESVQRFRSASDETHALAYAAEWVLDNDYLAMAALRQVEQDLPRSYDRQLPRFQSGRQAGFSRVHWLANELVLAGQARLEIGQIERFVEAFQEITPLKMGEMWALPALLRFAVVQALCEAAARLTGPPERLAGLPFPFFEWPAVVSDDEIVAASFTSLRVLAAQDWKAFFEELSIVEHVLGQDPPRIYLGMDFATRDRYRKAVEKIAAHAGRDEVGVALAAIRLAQESMDSQPGAAPGYAAPTRSLLEPQWQAGPQAHVGYYLVGAGRKRLEAEAAYRAPLLERFARWLGGYREAAYLGSILGLFLLIWGAAGAHLLLNSGGPTLGFFLGLFLSIIPALSVAVHLVHWAITHLLPPRVLPRMDFSAGLPAAGATLVAVPTLLASPGDAASLVSQIELHYLRNPDPRLHYALVTDFGDANEAHLPGDAALIESVTSAMNALNRKYRRKSGGPFLFLHRERRWNPGEGIWMGWERKRGKLHELNALILSARDRRQPSRPAVTGDSGQAGFAVQVGALGVLAGIRYVITLDADTVFPPGEAGRLVGALAHPLNRAVFEPGEDGRLRSGYSILQPRTKILPNSAGASIFTRIFSGDAGLDLYSLAVSDVYQDLFGEGIYVGKGIYDVQAFERSLAGRAPENSLLSHDLFEGIHGRAALVTDSILLEDYPTQYLVHTRRLHRWIRGDWQLLPWLLPRVPGEAGWIPNRLNAVARWKIADNLRRSLVQPSLLALLTAAWLGLLPGSPFFGTLAALLVLALPLLTEIASSLLSLGKMERPAGALRRAARALRASLLRWLLAVIFLPFEAFLSLSAITVTLGRLLVTRRNLLRWTTAAQTEKRFKSGLDRQRAWIELAPAALGALAAAGLIIALNPAALPVAAPLLLAWLVSPEAALWISRNLEHKPELLAPDEQAQLRSLARRTWLFFEQFVGPEDHWLPPDHFQEAPLGKVAHRTSPTNIGLNLLAILGAYDLGYIGLPGLEARLRSSFDTLAELEKHRGHFLNWYDTRTLEPLLPRYVSTVDSGNLAACLIALRQGLLALVDAPILRWATFQGLLDSLDMLTDHLQAIEPGEAQTAIERLLELLAQIRNQILSIEADPLDWACFLLGEPAAPGPGRAGWQALEQYLLELVEEHGGAFDPESLRRLRLYVNQLRQRLSHAQRELDFLHPWWRVLSNPPELFSRPEQQVFSNAWQKLRAELTELAVLGQIERAVTAARAQLDEILHSSAAQQLSATERAAVQDWVMQMNAQLDGSTQAAQTLLAGFRGLAAEAETYVQEMNFAFLFNPARQVFYIGYNLAVGRPDNNYYDLLASEARIASLVAIAWGQAPASHWLHLGRPLTEIDGRQVLLSWSATMFEYLMPRLLLRHDPNTLLAASLAAAVDIQHAYGEEQRTPWGISESGYYRFDPGLAYQYQAFGAPGLGYKRGLGDDLVIAPYASVLALSLRPRAVLENINALKELGALGAYGLYEALDFTPARLPLGSRFELVREYMAHHQGMIFLSLVNYFLDDRMVQRFHADPRIRSVELLLQEQIPPDAPLEQAHTLESSALRPEVAQVSLRPWRVRVKAPQPRLHYLSNGQYGLLVTASGGGYSAWRELMLTRWQADASLGGWGTWIYIQDLHTGGLWSAGFEPTGVAPDSRDVYFHAHMASFVRRDGDISTALDLGLAPDADVELRSLTLTNHSDQPRRLRLTSYSEVVLAPPAGDRRHPAFSKLFVESEYSAPENTLLFRRRPRSDTEEVVYLAHSLVVDGNLPLTRAYETDRARFLGRNGAPRAPQALLDGHWLSGTVGATLDPIMALGQEVLLPPHAGVRVVFLTLAAATRAEALALSQRFQSLSAIERAFAQSRSAAETELLRLGLAAEQLPRIQHLLSALVYPHQALRAPLATLQANRKGQPALWPYAISGDFPILQVSLSGVDELPLLQDLLQAHAYWRSRHLKIDLVVINEQGRDYGQELASQTQRLLTRLGGDAWLNRRGGIFLLMADQLAPDDRTLLETAARVVLDGSLGSLAAQLPGGERTPVRLPGFIPSLPAPEDTEPTPRLERPVGLLFDNGYGGFSPDGREYVIYLEPGQALPAPWINVIANPQAGCLVSESGLGYSWAINSGENRLTPWRNDPVSDQPGEALYLRDEETAAIWSPTPQPAPAANPYEIRHGAGYTRFTHLSHGLRQQVTVFAPALAPVKIVQVRLENLWARTRRITATYYVEWVLGVNREDMQPYLLPDYDSDTQSLLVCNPYNVEFGERVAFAAANKRLHGLTTDRTEFLGRLGSYARPAALTRVGLAGTVQPGLDQCAALQLHIDLPPGEQEEIFFLLGQGANRAEAIEIARQLQQPGALAAAWDEMQQHWDSILSAVTVETPDPAMDLLLNRWLLYQSLAGRLWGRSALYQSSGAYGFRDQLQDVMAGVYAAPALAREHILRAAAHQFDAGDVLHWWHPPSGRGVRTRFSDDLLWLPFVTAFYVRTTGDEGILDENAPFLVGPPLEPEQDERYGLYARTPETATLFEHCLRALEKGATAGAHGLPLMGSGDWNDGMNRVGHAGRGESVWLGWFLVTVLRDFAQLCEQRGARERAALLRAQAGKIAAAIETHAWDGAWYLRAFYDDGAPLGSARNRECQIDAIAQSWSVLSGAGDPGRARQAMQAVWERLVRPADRLILLFAPPFDKTPRDPGYIKGYVPGVRENGGQYTHAAIWTAWAFASLGDGQRAAELFNILNPILHAHTPAGAARYKVEPYVIAADVYGVPPHTGRGGWTWYTGSASWMYRLGIEAILGLRLAGDSFSLDPCIPPAWPGFKLRYSRGQSTYLIEVRNPQGVSRGVYRVSLDGVEIPGGKIPLAAGLAPPDSPPVQHAVVVELGDAGQTPGEPVP